MGLHEMYMRMSSVHNHYFSMSHSVMRVTALVQLPRDPGLMMYLMKYMLKAAIKEAVAALLVLPDPPIGIGYMACMEFQTRGLPHMHALLWF